MEVEEELEIEFTQRAKRDYHKLDKERQKDVRTKISQKRANPLMGARLMRPQLQGKGCYAWRAGKLRIFFDFNKENGVITIRTIDYRKQSYKTGRRR